MSFFPRNILIIFVFVILSPIALIGALTHNIFETLLAALFFIIFIIFDLFFSIVRAKKIEFHFPDILKLNENKKSKLEIRAENKVAFNGEISVCLPLPPEFYSETTDVNFIISKNDLEVQVPIVLTGLKRGHYILTEFYAAYTSIAGFWRLRYKPAVKVEVKVYPDLLFEKKTIAALRSGRFYGLHSNKMVGKGKEFEKLREYTPGDSFEDIHWKATARKGFPVSKVFQIERTQDIYVFIDGSRLSARNADNFYLGSGNEKTEHSIFDRYLVSAMLIGLAARNMGDNFGVSVFSDSVIKFARAKTGRRHFDYCRDLLYSASPGEISPDFGEVFSFITSKISKRSLIIMLTNLDDKVIAENFISKMPLINRKHHVVCCMLKPYGANPIFSDEVIGSIDNIYKASAGHLFHRELNETGLSLKKSGISFLLLDNPFLSMQVIEKYIEIKRRQII